MLKNLKNFSLPQVEEKVLKFWKSQDIFKKSLQKNKGKKEFVFYEGPPTANGVPGIHHLLGRAFKDIIPRYKTMRGFNVPRQAGWDTHGLPVELQLEKELELKNKQAIEEYGIAKFNQKAKESVWRYKAEWEKFSERVGHWLDRENAYITYTSEYMESLFWLFSEINKGGYLKKLQRTIPWCPRCQTPLSSHELGQPGVYKTVKDASLYLKFELLNPRSEKKEFLLVWTTTPWTLPGNLAIALDPKLTYKKFEVKKSSTGETEIIYSYQSPPEKEGYSIKQIAKVKGKELLGLEYEKLFKLSSSQLKALKKEKLYQTRAGNFISTEEGTGFVHIAPSFGEEDFNLMKINDGLPVTISDSGKMAKGFPGADKYIKEADKDIVQDLDRRGLLYKFSKEKHEYPHCWRCDRPLIYMVRRSWFIEMSKLRAKLVAGNKKINWEPSHIKDGRFGKWLSEVKDWAISRNRYWGTPLPIWVAPESSEGQSQKNGETIVIGSLKDFAKYAPQKNNYYLLRHSEATSNIERVIASGPETSKNRTSRLTEKGKAQAKTLAKKLKKEKIEYIYASPYNRTKTTAQIIAKELGLKVKTDSRLKELNSGEFNWKPIEQLHGFFNTQIERFTKKSKGGESWGDLRARVMDFYSEADKKHKGANILVVSHGDCLWMLEGAMRGADEKELVRRKYYPNHTSWKKTSSSNLPFNSRGELDLHRPFIDEIKLKGKKGKILERVEDVADVWFDSGAMPFASQHFPFGQGKTLSKSGKLNLKGIPFPADYIAEGVDQTRGWFYTLHAIANLLGQDIAYKNVISYGLLHDKHGKKMSKSKGNVIDPVEMINKYGADACRWYLYTLNEAGDSKNFNEDALAKVLRKINLIIYNSFVFLSTYGSKKRDLAEPKHLLDSWILAELNKLIENVSKKLDKLKINQAGKEIESFIDSLSRWYIRRSRSRFQNPAKEEEKSVHDLEQASATLEFVLLELSKLLAPFMPFFSEALYRSITSKNESVHLEDWPKSTSKFANKELIKDMALLRSFAAKALAVRAEKQLKVRQPLASLSLKDTSLKGKKALLEVLADEVNVKAIKFSKSQKEELILDTKISPLLKEEGLIREISRAVQGLRQTANYQMGEKIILYLEGDETLISLIKNNKKTLEALVNAKQIEFKKAQKFDAKQETKIEGKNLSLAVKK